MSVGLTRARGARGFEGDPVGANPGVGGHEHQRVPLFGESLRPKVLRDRAGVSGGPGPGRRCGCDYRDAVPGGGSADPSGQRNRSGLICSIGFLNASRLRGRSLSSVPVLAQTAYPNKPIRLIVSVGAGGATDGLARRLADRLSKSMNTPVLAKQLAKTLANSQRSDDNFKS